MSIREKIVRVGRNSVMLLVLAGLIFICDQLSKAWAVKHLRYSKVKEVIEGYIALRYVENVGGAWGCLSEAPEEFRYPFFVIASLVAMIFIIVVYHRADPKERLLKIALGLVLGGAIGNFADRVRLYYVIDFIDLHIEDKFHWPTFNIADAAISIGVGLMIFDMLPSRRKKKQAES